MTQRRTHKKGLSTYCPACGSDIHFRRLPRRGSTVTCRQCQSFLEVIRLAPLTLEWAFEEPFEDDDFEPESYRDYHDRQSFETFDQNGDEADDDWDEEWDEDWDDEVDEP